MSRPTAKASSQRSGRAGPVPWPVAKVRKAALAVGLFQTVFVGVAIWFSGYFRDDYLFLTIARRGGFSGTQLTRTVFGSLVPGFQFGNSVLASLQPIPRWPAVVMPVVLYALALFLFFRLAELLFGSRPILIPLLALAGLSGVLELSLVWWTAGLDTLPTLVLDLLALDGLARHAATGRRRHLVVSVLSFAIGITFYDASSSFLAVLVAFAALYLFDLRDWRAVLRGVRSLAWVWAGYVVPIALNFAWRKLHPANYVLPPLPSVWSALRFIVAGWAQGYLPSTLGVPFLKLSSGLPRVAVVVVGQALFFGLVVVSIRLRRSAWKAWVMFGCGFLAIEVVAAIGRAAYGTEFAINTLFWIAQPFLLSLAIGLAFLPSRVGIEAAETPERSAQPMWNARLMASVTVVVAVICGLGAYTIWSSSDRTQGRQNSVYMANLAQSWEQVHTHVPDAFVWNTEVPSFIITPFFTPYNRVATTGGLLTDLRVDATRGDGYLVGDDGHLFAASAQVVSRAEVGSPGALCFARAERSRVEHIALTTAVPSGYWFLRLRYARASGFSTSLDGVAVPFARGSGSFVTPDGTDGKATFALQIPAGASTCITGADFEKPVPRAAP